MKDSRNLLIFDAACQEFEDGSNRAEVFYGVGRQMALEVLFDASLRAEKGDPMAQRIVVKIGSLMPHLINVGPK